MQANSYLFFFTRYGIILLLSYLSLTTTSYAMDKTAIQDAEFKELFRQLELQEKFDITEDSVVMSMTENRMYKEPHLSSSLYTDEEGVLSTYLLNPIKNAINIVGGYLSQSSSKQWEDLAKEAKDYQPLEGFDQSGFVILSHGKTEETKDRNDEEELGADFNSYQIDWNDPSYYDS